MADDDHGARIAREIVGQPQRAFEIEIVGRLVEQQQVGLGEQHRGERHAHAPAAGEIRAGALLRGRVEAEAGEDRGGARRRRMRADVGEPRLDLGDAMRIVRGLGLGEQARALGVGGEHDVDQAFRPARRLLREPPDARARRQADRAVLDANLAARSRGTAWSCRCRCGRPARRARRRECAPTRRRAAGGRRRGSRYRRARACARSIAPRADWQARRCCDCALPSLRRCLHAGSEIIMCVPGCRRGGPARIVAARIFQGRGAATAGFAATAVTPARAQRSFTVGDRSDAHAVAGVSDLLRRARASRSRSGTRSRRTAQT